MENVSKLEFGVLPSGDTNVAVFSQPAARLIGISVVVFIAPRSRLFGELSTNGKFNPEVSGLTFLKH